MKRSVFICLLVHLFWLQCFCSSLVNADYDEDTWMDPDAWARDHLVTEEFQSSNIKCCKCVDSKDDHVKTEKPTQELKGSFAEDVASSIYFKKFVTMLFNREDFKHVPTKESYERALVFVISSSQMEKLEQSQDPRDLDNILSEVFNNIKSMNINFAGQDMGSSYETSPAITTLAFNILYHMWRLLNTSEMRFFLIVISVILSAWLINKRLKISWLLLVSGGVLIYGYFHTYLECNRELEVNQMLEILNTDTETESRMTTSKVINLLKGFFIKDDVKIRQQQKIRQSAKLSLGFCRPDHVFLMYFNDIFVKYLQILIEQCAIAITSLNAILGFPYSFLTPVLVVYLVAYLLKLSFKYILRPSEWYQLAQNKRFRHQNEEKCMQNVSNSENDRISGDNLKLLLNAINAAPQKNVAASKLQNSSGVEDVREAIEPGSVKISPTIEENKPQKLQNNNVSCKTQSVENDEVRMEYLPENS